MEALGPDILHVLEIIWVNIILSGDNAVVIALACRGLPENRRRLGMLLGAGVAVALRIVFTLVLAALLTTPFLKIVGGLFLFWIAIQLVGDSDEEADAIHQSPKLWQAVRTIAVADAIMSLDNVLAIAAVAEGSVPLLITGLLISIPLIVAGATVIMKLLDRLPVLVWAGAGLLGWLAGDMIVTDPALIGQIGETTAKQIAIPVAATGAVLVLCVGFALTRWRRAEREAAATPSA